jgi:hypothetical protein
MRRYRWRMLAAGRPEASAVDIAVAAAVAAHAARAAKDPSVDAAVLKELLRDAVDRLVAAGHSRAEARGKVIRRVGRFSGAVPGASLIRNEDTQLVRSSPHYSVERNRKTLEIRSDGRVVMKRRRMGRCPVCKAIAVARPIPRETPIATLEASQTDGKAN